MAVTKKKRGGQVLREHSRSGRVILRILPLGYKVRFLRKQF